MPHQLARLVQCVRCLGGRFDDRSSGLACLECGHVLAVIDGVLHATRDGEDAAIERERRAVLEIEAAATPGPFEFSFERLMSGPGPLRTAFLSLPYDDGSAFFRDDEYFRNVHEFASTFDTVVSRLPLPAGSLVLDVGADLTWSTARLAARGWRAVAIDINHHLAAVRLFREQGLDVCAVNVDMHAPLFADEAFDGVTAFNALHHTHRLDALVENLARTLKPGGYLAFIEPYWEHEDNRTTFGVSQIEAGINENVYRLEEWHRTFVGHGLEPVFFVAGASFHGLYRKVMDGTRRTLSVAEARVDLFRRFYQAELSATPDPLTSAPGRTFAVPVRVRNVSQASWSSDFYPPVLLSYHLRRDSGLTDQDSELEMVAFDNARTPLPGCVYPGDEVVVALRVTAPLEPGDYWLDVDLVHEGVTWFADLGATSAVVDLHVAHARLTERA